MVDFSFISYSRCYLPFRFSGTDDVTESSCRQIFKNSFQCNYEIGQSIFTTNLEKEMAADQVGQKLSFLT